MFKKTFQKLNQGLQIGATKSNTQSNLLQTISKLKQEGNTLFGAIYSSHNRHTVYKAVEDSDYSKSLKRRSTYDYMNNFTTVVLPQIEKFVERRLIEKFKMNLSEAERTLIEDTYNMRRHLADTQNTIRPADENKAEEVNVEESIEGFKHIFSSINGEGLRYHEFEDIGKYVYFPGNKRQEYFPFGCYGDYMKKEHSKTKMFSVMCREEGVKLTRAFSNITTHKERVNLIDYEAILNKKYNFKEELKNYEVFSLFFQEMSYSLLKVLETSRNFEYNYLFTNPEIFDSLVTVLVRSMKIFPISVFLVCPNSRYKMISQIVKILHENFGNNLQYTSEDIKDKGLKVTEKEFYPLNNFSDIIEKIKLLLLDVDNKDIWDFAEKTGIKLDEGIYADLKEHIESKKDTKGNIAINLTSHWEGAKSQWRPQEMREQLPNWKGFNSGILLTGEGNGKSMILTYLHAWAKESGWCVIPVNDTKKFTRDGYPIERHLSGIYFQPELAQQLMKDIKIVNYELLLNTSVDLNEYGKYNIAGIRDGDPEPNPVLWDQRSQTYTDSWKEWNTTPEEEIVAEDHPDHNIRLRDSLPKPKTLLDIVNKGVENHRIATSAFAELMNQLAKSENVKTMFIVDDYNELFKPTIYDSYKYANFSNYRGKIPPHDIALPRMFMKFDGHFLKNGVKVCSISLKEYPSNEFKPQLINFPKGYSLQVDNLKLNDVRNALTYYSATQYSAYYSEYDIQDAWQLSQGNWKHLHHDLSLYFRSVPSQKYWMQRKAVKKVIAEAKKF